MSDIAEVKTLIEDQGKAWNEYQKTNDELLKAKADGGSIDELQAKLDLINTDMEAQRKSFEEIEKKLNRPGAGADDQLTEDQVEYKKAFNGYLRKGNDQGLEELQRKAMNSQSDPNGGFLILPEMDLEIERVVPTISTFAGLADNITVGTAKWQKMVKTSGMAMRRVADGSNGGESDAPEYAKVEIEAHSAEVEPWVFNETLEDSIVNLESDLAGEAAIAFAEGLGSEVITGVGVDGARGITKYNNVANSAYSWGNVGYIASGKSAGFASVAPADALIDLQHALKQQYRPGATWILNDTTLGIARQMKDASGSFYLWNPDPAGGFGGRFLGSPVSVDDNMPDIGAGSFSVAYGDFKRAYKIVNRRGTTLLRDPYTAKGQTKFNFTRRFGGGVFNYEAYKTMKFSVS